MVGVLGLPGYSFDQLDPFVNWPCDLCETLRYWRSDVAWQKVEIHRGCFSGTQVLICLVCWPQTGASEFAEDLYGCMMDDDGWWWMMDVHLLWSFDRSELRGRISDLLWSHPGGVSFLHPCEYCVASIGKALTPHPPGWIRRCLGNAVIIPWTLICSDCSDWLSISIT